MPFGPGHEPHTCQEQCEIMTKEKDVRDQFEIWRRENAEGQEKFDELIQSQGWKLCPVCGAGIERTEGCDHMTCRYRSDDNIYL